MIQDDQIRILSLYPYADDEDAPIVCHTEVASLTDEPEYDALSYVWGSSDVLIDIVVADQKIGVTQNLHSALRRLRLKDKVRPLWVDQLCINQWDLQEKKSQVQLMRKIYSRCRTCCLWMGEIKQGIRPEDAENALEFIKFMAATADVETEEEKNSIPPLGFFHSDDAFRKPMEALKTMSLPDNPWWERVWTVQEAVLPKEMQLYWGHLSLPWDRMARASVAWTSYIPPCIAEIFEEASESFLGDLMAMIVWLRIAADDSDEPAWLIHRWRFRQATDPRDKIYALMGLSEKGQLPTVEECDYDVSAVEVFCGLTFDLMQHYQTLIPLIMDPRIEPEKATADIPRWALDVSYISDYNTDWHNVFGWYDYHACGETWLDVDHLREKFLQDKARLALEGVLVDTIEVVGVPYVRHRHEPHDPDEVVIEHIRGWERLAQQYVKMGTKDSKELYPGDLTLRDAFGRLLLGDLVRNEEQWPGGEEESRVTDWHLDAVYEFLETGTRPHSWIHGTMLGMTKCQTFFVTKKGLIGLAHRDTQVGDQVWVLHGGNVPFTLTPRENEPDDFDFVGGSYVQGIMQGDIFSERIEDIDERKIWIH